MRKEKSIYKINKSLRLVVCDYMKKKLFYLISLLFFVIFLLVFLIVLFKNVSLNVDIDFLVSNFGSLLLILIFILFLVKFFDNKKFRFSDKKSIIILTILLFGFDLLLVLSIPFKPGWDAGVLIDSAYYNVFSKSNIIFDTGKHYFEMYPNNICLLLYEMGIALFTKFLGRNTLTYIFFLGFLNCIIFSLVGIMVYFIQKRISSSSKVALLSWSIYVILVGSSPWVLVPYSDSLGLLFPCLIFFIYLFVSDDKFYKWMLISLLSFLGYHIKPQILLIFIAIILIVYIKLLFSKKFKKLIIYTSVIICSYLVLSFCFSSVSKMMDLDKNKEIGISHFLMMGMNYDTNGIYSEEDVKISLEADTIEERFDKNIEIFRNRVNEYGVNKLFKHFYHKILVNFNDGTFFFGKEGNFYNVVYCDMYPDRYIDIPWLKDVFYSTGEYYLIGATIRQGVWLFVLLLLGLSFPKKDENEEILILKLTLIGLFLFELLFEARSRYLFTFVPLFVIIAIDNFYKCINRCRMYFRRSK